MSEVIWKAFKLGDLFTTKNGRDSSIAQKNLDKSDIKDDEYNISIVTESMFNNAIGFYLKDTDPVLKDKIVKKGLTIGTQFGNANWHNYPHFIIGNVNYITFNDEKFYSICNDYIGIFLAILINRIFKKSELFGYMNKIDQSSFYRELILLPCLEVAEGEDYIWEENGKHYTLAVEYIKKLMNEAKELREQKTIRLYEAERAKYEAERAKYEAERAKYEAEYKKERENVVWKSFRLGDLFDWNSKHKISKSTKEYNELNHYEDGYVANITAGMYNEGIACYLPEDDEIKSKRKINCLTISSNGAGVGACFFHDYYIVSTGDNALLEPRNAALQKIFDQSKIASLYFAKIITKLFRNNGIFSWTYKVSKDDFRREIILLPCLEVAEGEDYIWEENGKHYTLAVNFISYLYLSGKVNYNQKLIDNYTYQY